MPRGFETEADTLAIQMTSAAGHDPRELILYISRIQTEDSARPKTGATLALLASRIAHMEQAMQALPSKAYASNDEFLRIQSEVRRLMPHRLFL
jgi:predicted Zn-dependent protease